MDISRFMKHASLPLQGPDAATFSSLHFTGVKPSLTPTSSSMALRLGPKCRTTTNPSFIHCFSSSSKCTESPPIKGSSIMSLYKYKESFKIRSQSGNVIGGGFEILVFGKEMKDKNEGKISTLKTDFMKTYSFGELGETIRMLRQDKQVEFSLDELNARLIKLREIEEEKTESNKVGGVTYKVSRDSLAKLNLSSQEKEKKTQTIDTVQKRGYLGQLGGTPNYMLARQYFHPDNMSSAEKLKIELHKLRDEFKMSESDCGSARVQVAQLTTKIKHVASVLHKKDKHSRKGLQEMVQRRKKLLKYLRRTDWDSYCLVLSKLSLRDNPGYKN